MAAELEHHVQRLIDDLLLEAAADVSLCYVSAANARLNGLKMQQELDDLEKVEDAREKLRERHVARYQLTPRSSNSSPTLLQVLTYRGACVCAL
jgi:hypothetical protein